MELDKEERKELARKMALQRSKIDNRRKLTNGKEEGANGIQHKISRRGNMLSITGYEANGCPIRAESLKNLIFFLLLGIVLLHLFTKNT